MNPRPVVATLTAAVLLVACSSSPDDKPKADRPPITASTTASPTPTPTPTPTSTPTVPSLLSGRLGAPNGPILVAKVDNTREAHPQVGLTKADVVYIEQVEGGVTRLAAVFSSALPRTVGPVRSARISDIELLRQYGTVGLIYSGSQTKMRKPLRRAKLKLVSYDENQRGYTRSPSRPRPYDVMGTMSVLTKRAGKVSSPTAAQVGYDFGPPPAGGKPAKAVTARYPMARVGAVWSGGKKKWLFSMDGLRDMAAEGGQLGATTFVIQFVTITGSRFHDVNGVITPTSKTVGAGRALIFRDGRVFEGRWSRPKAANPTSYTIGGQRAVFAAGNVWVALLGKGRPVLVG